MYGRCSTGVACVEAKSSEERGVDLPWQPSTALWAQMRVKDYPSDLVLLRITVGPLNDLVRRFRAVDLFFFLSEILGSCTRRGQRVKVVKSGHMDWVRGRCGARPPLSRAAVRIEHTKTWHREQRDRYRDTLQVLQIDGIIISQTATRQVWVLQHGMNVAHEAHLGNGPRTRRDGEESHRAMRHSQESAQIVTPNPPHISLP